MRDFKLSLLLAARDEMSGPTSRAFQLLKRESDGAASAFQRLSQAASRSATAQAQAVTQAAGMSARVQDASLSSRLREYQRFNQAYATLGLRTEAQIQREIQRTEAAYQRLARSGAMSADEQARAFQRMHAQVAELNREMGRVSAKERGLKRFQGGMNTLRGVGEGMLGVAGAVHAVTEPVKETMSFDRRVAMMANTAFNEKSVPERLAGEAQIRGAIRHTINLYGGDLDRVTETLDQLLSHNSMSHEQVFRLLPVLQKFATAEGADPNDLGNVVFKGLQNFGFEEAQVPKIMEMVIRGGHLGGFKLTDMSKWLPQQMAAGKNSGLSGTEGLASLIALNELSYTTAGTVDEAGNNVLDLLTHLNSRDTARSVKKYLHRDLSVAIANGRNQGKDSVTVFGDLLQEVADKDKNYQLLRRKLAATRDDDQRRAVIESMVDVVQGSAIGKIVHNRQELQALMAFINQKDKYQSIKQQTLVAQGNGDKDFAVIEQTAGYQTERAKAILDMGEKDALRGFSQNVGDAAKTVADYAAQHAGLTSAVMGSKVAFETITQAIIAIGLGKLVFGGKGEAASSAGKAAAAAGDSVAAGGVGSSFLGRLSALAGPLMSANTVANFTSHEEDEESAGPGTVEQNIAAKWAALRAKYPQSLIEAARKKYQPWYQFGSGFAAENAHWVEQYLADQARDPAHTPVGQRNAPLSAPSLPPNVLQGVSTASTAASPGILPPELQTLLQARTPNTITNQIYLDSHLIAEQINQMNAQAALRH